MYFQLEKNISLIDDYINSSIENNKIDICLILNNYLICFNELLFRISKKFKNNKSFIDKVAYKYSDYKNIYNINQQEEIKVYKNQRTRY